MKQFDIPTFYHSPIISAVKAKRKVEDPRKRNFSPSLLNFDKVQFWIPRHFGFCYGVENAIEKSYKAIAENPGKKIYLISEMIHNPGVNEDLQSHGIQFIQDTGGKQLIPWEAIKAEDIVIIPAFGTSLEIKEKLREIGVEMDSYNTTCPFVEKVWNRAEKLGNDEHTIIIHGKYRHEETRATFSHSKKNAPSLVVKGMYDAKFLADYLLAEHSTKDFLEYFDGKYSEGFDPEKDLVKIGVVNQTTMLATETQEITDFLRKTMAKKYGEEDIKNHIADTRDTLCYATNDNQSATYGLLEQEADMAIVIGGFNSSNTTHLVELLETKFPTLFIRDEHDLEDLSQATTFNIHTQEIESAKLLPKSDKSLKFIITSGASCPDSIVDRVMQKILSFYGAEKGIEEAIAEMS
jgi:4-hydroxy-3-methylbut-2-enyl diphosphate reductase